LKSRCHNLGSIIFTNSGYVYEIEIITSTFQNITRNISHDGQKNPNQQNLTDNKMTEQRLNSDNTIYRGD